MIGELRGKGEVYAWAIILILFLILGLFSGDDGMFECFADLVTGTFDFMLGILGVLSEKIRN